uniref:DUF4238 domain-containing protein n=1 Tax=Curvibacter symbiont subsp. Hydra magnipapillata TaxID=667019 RepID=C9YBX3_CURXX|nr:hypothetical protein Csp_C22020 [Curvibacter putative symbiont of Hydra magnipapillata]
MLTKKQHYVPQFLLRRFAAEAPSGWKTNVFDIERQQLRNNQNVKDVCAENYMYDKDNSFESFLGEHVENPASKEIDSIIATPEKISCTPERAMLLFLTVQIARTRQAYGANLAFLNKMMGTVFEKFAELNGMDVDAAKRVQMRPEEPRALLSYMAASAATNYRLIADLKVALIANQTGQEFVLSDNPVFKHNWYLRDCNEPLSASITVRGLQLFLPLSPKLVYCLYDSSVYAYKTDGPTKSVVHATHDDVSLLNSFQAINAESFLVANSTHMGAHLQSIGTKYRAAQAFTEHAMATQPTPDADGKLKSMHYVWREQIRLAKMPSFIKVKNKVRRRSVICEHRQPDLVAAHELAQERIKNENAP